MAKLYFYYSSMNAGKTTTLLQSDYNYRERGMQTLLYTPKIDDRAGAGFIGSRIGLKAQAETFDEATNLYKTTFAQHQQKPIDCVLIDEAQFLNKEQVEQLSEVVDRLHIPVLAYGLRTDYQGEPFEGSRYLLAWADNLVEIKTICHCGKKATHVLRLDAEGKVITQGSQVLIGGNDRYVSVCRKHFKQGKLGIG